MISYPNYLILLYNINKHTDCFPFVCYKSVECKMEIGKFKADYIHVNYN